MSTEALVLALTTVVRPMSAAAVVAMLSTAHPRRLLVFYIVAGLAFSLAVGTVVVLLVQGLGPATDAGGRPYVDTALGALALAYAAAAAFGWLPRRRAGSRNGSEWMRKRLQHLSPTAAAMAGVVTHLPGLVYLAALNAIVGDATGTVDAVVQVVLYNAIWFSLPITALVLAHYHPELAKQSLAEVGTWIRRHQRVITIVFLVGLGGYLLVIGVLGLLYPPN
ncbi:GAP family protein [Pseudonocardia sp. CA-142604]|uniref:GAP family protein n=1 Tax=Pseudonocardia sp. CA-142604 TaxID=3240024 RepID=UPI003D925AA4